MKSPFDKISLKTVASLSTVSDVELVIVPWYADGGLPKFAKQVDEWLDQAISKVVSLEKFDAEKDKTLWVRPLDGSKPAVLVVSVGKHTDLDRDFIREQYFAAGKTIKAKKCKSVAVIFSPDKKIEKHHDALLEGLVYSLYQYDYPKQKKEEHKGLKNLYFVADGTSLAKELDKTAHQTKSIMEAVFLARDLVNGPANTINPTSFTQTAQSVAKTAKIKCKVIGYEELKRKGMNLIVAVGMGSVESPRLLHLEYKHKSAKKAVAIVGKGVTFDSGGLSLKPPSYMYGMKGDMAGGAAALATIQAVSALQLRVHLHVLIPLVENLPSDRSVKPGDVFVGYNGKSVEIENTDAEGRLILADALTYAARHLAPDVMIDLATLTGACVVALGDEVAGMMGTHQETMDTLAKVSKVTGEKIWPLPLEKKYQTQLKSDVADMRNVGGKYAGAITAGLFLSEFVEETPWVHLDIAGPAFADSPNSLGVKGGTGFPVRTLIEFLKTRAV